MMTIASQLLPYPTGNLCNANAAVQALDSAIKPLLPRDIAETIAKQAKQVVDKEDSIRTRILAGESTFEIFGLGRS